MKNHLRALFAIVIANYIAQIPYNFHIYHTLSRSSRGSLLLIGSFLLFIIPYALIIRKKKGGYAGMLAFLSIEFLFYLLNFVGGIAMGYGWFFQLANPDPLLFAVFFVGYANFLAAGYFIYYFIRKSAILYI